MGLFEFIVILAIGGTIAKAVARRISNPPYAASADLREHLEITEQRLEDTEHRLAETSERLAELEERLDFTERMLARHDAREQLNP